MNTASPLRLLALAGLSLTTFTMLAGCSDTDTDSTTASQAEDHSGHDHGSDADADEHTTDTTPNTTTASTASPDVYKDILGEIKLLPIAGDPSTALKIHHQQIPDFKLKDGTINTNSKGISGMMSMTMPFPLADGVSVEGLAIGDKIMFTFAVNWSGQGTAWEVTQIEKIDADTEIDFTNAVP